MTYIYMRQCRLKRKIDPLVKRVIILSQARSGSTLLQRILHCCIADANFHGENHNFWGHLSNGYYAWKKSCQRPESVGTYTKDDNFKPCWWNSYKPHDVLRSYRKLFDEMYLSKSHRVVGFKEVRVPQNPEDFRNFIEFFREMFPNCYFVFTYRNIDSIVKSGWWKESDRTHLAKMEKILRDYARSHPDFVHLISYDDMMKTDKMRGLFTFLGEPLNVPIYERVKNKVYK